MILEYLKDNNLIICPNSLKKSVISMLNTTDKLISYKIMSLEEFKNKYCFSYSKKTIYYLMNKLNLKLEIILEYLDSLYYIEDKEYKSAKLNNLVLLKKELLDNNLLEENKLFLNYLNNTTIILYGYQNIDLFYEKIFSQYDYYKITNNIKNNNLTVYEFDSIEDEISYVCHDIKEKLDLGISLSNIKLVVSNDEYKKPLARIFKWCHLPLNTKNNISLYNTEIGKIIINEIKKDKSFAEILAKLINIDDDIKNMIISLFNSYIEIEAKPINLLEMIEYDLKHTYLKENEYKNKIEIVPLSLVSANDYIYLLGFNKENYPTIYKDEEFLTDLEKEELGLFTSNQKNINSISELKNNIYNIDNLIISYKNKNFFNSYNPCILTEEMNVVKDKVPNYKLSNLYNKITLAEEYDKFYKYGIHNQQLDLLNSNYKNINYRSYDNSFTNLDSNLLIKSLPKPFTLSYSSIDKYFRCGFQYYVNYILNINEEMKDKFYMEIGNIFHYVLSKSFLTDFDFDTNWNEEASKYDFDFSKQILLDRLKSELKYDIETIKKQMSLGVFDDAFYEKKFILPIKNTKNIDVNLYGVVDKISYHKYGNKTLVSIIDYKTGSLHTDLNPIIYGINMQLPIYLYFIKNSDLFENSEFVGFYLQKIINKDIKKEVNKSVDQLKEEALKLVGYSTDNVEYLEKFDTTFINSKIIYGLKVKKDGNFYDSSKILTDKNLIKMNNLVSEKLEESVESILNAQFKINPKKYDKDNLGCSYCSYRDICFKTEKDIVELEKHKNLDFLGGD